MNNNFKILLDLYACAINSTEPDADISFDIEEITKLANNQGILAIIMPVLKKIPFVYENEGFRDLYNKFIVTVVNESVKKEKIKLILKQLEYKNINFCILKGETLANLYPSPETRFSGDVDILVNESDEMKALSVFRNNGFKIEYRTDGANHNICSHPELGYIELHVKLFYDFIVDVWFDNVNLIEEEYVENYDIKTLGYTDGYLHVLFHALEHFIVGGVSLRHFSDVILYAKKYKDKIDFNRASDILNRVRYTEFEKLVYFIGEKYFNIKGVKNIEDFDEELSENVFEDMIKGGIFGKNDSERKNFFETYNKIRFSTFKKEDFSEYMTNWRRYNAKKVISFSKENLYKRYPYASKNIVCYLVAMVEHSCYIVKKGFERTKIVKDVISYKVPKISESSEKRLDLLKKLKMI